ncbi:nitrogen fixation protein NifM [Thiococcus pfennigii]|uniref:nitrogen fixation protein NifM n=1 Tax=Thiococcus pfennigii TaxID=1057 RepID=UPI0019066608|nr:nitrogen fixation protein NifM [Thiococcus pfennigii]MBK1702472.1 nitrogen fixation protein NifM [Thiococcus pfennigii]
MSAARARAQPHDAARERAYRYHLLRVATARYQRDPAHLEPDELGEAERQAERSLALEERVLASGEAIGVVISEAEIANGLATIAERYADAGEMADDLARNGLDEAALREALRRELVFDAVMRRVGARHAAVTDEEIERLYRDAPERFARPERRTVRHILITINEGFAENGRTAATARAERLAAMLREQPGRFDELARAHSECPTALEGGRIGTVPRGRLYPSLDAVLFGQAEGTIAGPIETEIGLHLLLCEQIHPAASLSLDQARERIRTVLTDRRRRAAQETWLAELERAATPG